MGDLVVPGKYRPKKAAHHTAWTLLRSPDPGGPGPLSTFGGVLWRVVSMLTHARAAAEVVGQFIDQQQQAQLPPTVLSWPQWPGPCRPQISGLTWFLSSQPPPGRKNADVHETLSL